MIGPPAIKPVEFIGDSLGRLRDFPAEVRAEAGHELFRVQVGRDPTDWKPMKTIGAGVREIRIRDATGAFRVIYVAVFAEAVYVLHAFRKKTQRTERADIDLAKSRYRLLRKGKP
jgi:phage-related protein